MTSKANGLPRGKTAATAVVILLISVLIHAFPVLQWSFWQWMPHSSMRRRQMALIWQHWRHHQIDNPKTNSNNHQYYHDSTDPQSNSHKNTTNTSTTEESSSVLTLATVSISDYYDATQQTYDTDALLAHLESTYGADWRRRPLLLQSLWTAEQLAAPDRNLSQAGLLQYNNDNNNNDNNDDNNDENNTAALDQIPYFSNASRRHLLTPDRQGSVSAIVANMTKQQPHKIGTQLLLQRHPEWITQVAPTAVVAALFGDSYFTPASLRPVTLLGGRLPLVPALTTVPVFVASPRTSAYTALHCEPIGNVAVQLSGHKQWTLIDNRHWKALQTELAPDGRAFFASFWDIDRPWPVPYYAVTTRAGDALWVPPWTWHQVEYKDNHNHDNNELSIAASLFHFRPVAFVRNNPLFAFLLIPAMIKELVGWNTQ